MSYYLFKIYVITTALILIFQYTTPFLLRAFELDKIVLGSDAGSPVSIEDLPYWKKLIYMILYNEHINISSSLWYSFMMAIGLIITKLISLQNTVFPGYGEQVIFIIGITIGTALLINLAITAYIYNYASDSCKAWYDEISHHSTDYWGIVSGSQSGSPTGSQDKWLLVKTFEEFLNDTCYIFYHSHALPKTTNLYLATIVGFCFIIAFRMKLNQIDYTTDYGPLDWAST